MPSDLTHSATVGSTSAAQIGPPSSANTAPTLSTDHTTPSSRHSGDRAFIKSEPAEPAGPDPPHPARTHLDHSDQVREHSREGYEAGSVSRATAVHDGRSVDGGYSPKSRPGAGAGAGAGARSPPVPPPSTAAKAPWMKRERGSDGYLSDNDRQWDREMNRDKDGERERRNEDAPSHTAAAVSVLDQRAIGPDSGPIPSGTVANIIPSSTPHPSAASSPHRPTLRYTQDPPAPRSVIDGYPFPPHASSSAYHPGSPFLGGTPSTSNTAAAGPTGTTTATRTRVSGSGSGSGSTGLRTPGAVRTPGGVSTPGGETFTPGLGLGQEKRAAGVGAEMDELTTKGRKRKRLAKACSACHKNKRRCDGFAPCSNCEFSSRPCLYLNAQGEMIPPPRTRDSSSAPTPAGHTGGATTPNGTVSARPGAAGAGGAAERKYSAPRAVEGVDAPGSGRRLADTHNRGQIRDRVHHRDHALDHDLVHDHARTGAEVRHPGWSANVDSHSVAREGYERQRQREREQEWEWAQRERAEREREREKERERERAAAERERRMHEVLSAVERDPAIGEELIKTFFETTPPFTAMFHPATFHHRVYLNQTSPLLLNAIYAFAARTCTAPTLLAAYSSPNTPTPAHLRGEAFAERAHIAAERILAHRRLLTPAELERTRGTWEETELAQAFVLLSIYFACLRQAPLALFYLDNAIDLVRPPRGSSCLHPARIDPDSAATDTELATLAEVRNRTFWLVVLHDLCAAANGRQRRLMDIEMRDIPLPGGEAWWVRYGGGGSTDSGSRVLGYAGEAQTGRRREGIDGSGGTWKGEEGAVGELGHVLRILSVFSDIMTVADNGGAGSSEVKGLSIHHHQDALKKWSLALPLHLRFNQPNLTAAMTRLRSSVPSTRLAAWAFGYMHIVAECGMFYLQAAASRVPGRPNASQSHLQAGAVRNIRVILHEMGEKGREGPMMVFPIAVVNNWREHDREVTLPLPQTESQLETDAQLDLWWREMGEQWGMEREEVIASGFYPGAQGAIIRAEHDLDGYHSLRNGHHHSQSSIRQERDVLPRQRHSAPQAYPTPSPSGPSRSSEAVYHLGVSPISAGASPAIRPEDHPSGFGDRDIASHDGAIILPSPLARGSTYAVHSQGYGLEYDIGYRHSLPPLRQGKVAPLELREAAGRSPSPTAWSGLQSARTLTRNEDLAKPHGSLSPSLRLPSLAELGRSSLDPIYHGDERQVRPYELDRHFSRNGDLSPSRHVADYSGPISNIEAQHEAEVSRDRSREVGGMEPLGIEALISAAESERERELERAERRSGSASSARARVERDGGGGMMSESAVGLGIIA